jgi:hypothetical protein
VPVPATVEIVPILLPALLESPHPQRLVASKTPLIAMPINMSGHKLLLLFILALYPKIEIPA